MTSDSSCPLNVELPKILSSQTQLWSRHLIPVYCTILLAYLPLILSQHNPFSPLPVDFSHMQTEGHPLLIFELGPSKSDLGPLIPTPLHLSHTPLTQRAFSHTRKSLLILPPPLPSTPITNPGLGGKWEAQSHLFTYLSVQIWLP